MESSCILNGRKDITRHRFSIGTIIKNAALYAVGDRKAVRMLRRRPYLLGHYFVTDVNGEIYAEASETLKETGFKTKCLNLIDVRRSMHYNPLAYLNSEKDIMEFSDMLTDLLLEGAKQNTTNKFWRTALRQLLISCIGFIYYMAPENEINLHTLSKMLNATGLPEVDDVDADYYKSAVDILFERLEEEDEEHFAVRQYKIFKLQDSNTRKSASAFLAQSLSIFDLNVMEDMMVYDEMELDKFASDSYFAEEPLSALFVIVPESDSPYLLLYKILKAQLSTLTSKLAIEEGVGVYPQLYPSKYRLRIDKGIMKGLPQGKEVEEFIINSADNEDDAE